MKKMVTLIIALFLSANVIAAETANGGWTSSPQVIVEVESLWSFTKFKVSDTSGCGNQGDGYWILPTTMGDVSLDKALDYKKSLLLSAFVANKAVMLRCENSAISDLVVRN